MSWSSKALCAMSASILFRNVPTTTSSESCIVGLHVALERHQHCDSQVYWGHARRVVIKAEVVRLPGRDPRDNPRFVVTTLRPSARFVYEQVYCARGDIENRIKELHV